MKSKKIIVSLLSLVTMAGMASCGGTEDASSVKPSTENSASESNKESDDKTSVSESTSSYDLTKKVDLTMSVYYDNNDRHMKFIEGAAATLPYTGADGTTYKAGDFKPVWRALQKNLNFTIDDVSPTGKVTIKDNFATLVSSAFKSNDKDVNIAQGNSDQIISEGTTTTASGNPTILDLSKHLDEMPNFKKFLTENPVVRKTISDSNGAIYFAPYFDGFDDIERMLMVRQDWVEMLLDGDLPTTLDETKTLAKEEYTASMPNALDTKIDVVIDGAKGSVTKKYEANEGIIARMNSETTLNGKTAVQVLRQYIDATYKNADGTPFYGTKRSQLFVGQKAAYDADEMVALFRAVKLNGTYLTGDATKNIIPFFPRARTNDRTADLFRLMQFWGVRGVESRNNYFYIGDDGKVTDARLAPKFKDTLEHLHQMYDEGLIYQDFTEKLDTKDDFRGPFLQKDMGFATYDYNQTTTAYNDDATCAALNGGKFLFASCLPAVADWGDGKYIHYTESWRSVKTQGWFITQKTANDADKLSRALALFDYLYSEEGNRVMSYGPDAWIAKNEDGTIKTMDYQGKQVPVLADATKKELKDLAKNNYTNYYRYYLGGTFPVGYVKEQGMEFQCVSSKAQTSLNDINIAIQTGVLQHVNHLDNNASHMQDILPTVLPYTAAEQTAISGFTDLSTQFISEKKDGVHNVMADIIMNGWGSYNDFDYTKENFDTTVKTTLKLDSYLSYANDAYTRFKAL